MLISMPVPMGNHPFYIIYSPRLFFQIELLKFSRKTKKFDVQPLNLEKAVIVLNYRFPKGCIFV